MNKNKHISKNASVRELLRIKLTPEEIKNHKEYMKFLKGRFGVRIHEVRVPEKSTCPSSLTPRNPIETDRALRKLQEKYDRA